MMNPSSQVDNTNNRQHKKRNSQKAANTEGNKLESAPETSQPKQPSRKQCFDFNKGSCARGSACKFEHSIVQSETEEIVLPPTKKPKTCFAFQKGNCTRGSNCKFEHSLSPEMISSNISSSNSLVGSMTMTKVNESSSRSEPQNQKASKNTKRSKQATDTNNTTINTAVMKSNDIQDEIDCNPVPNVGQLAHISNVEFRSLSISPLTKKALAETMKYELMTQVQAMSLPVILSGHDCLAKAKTGTGKTLAFLIPAIEQLNTQTQSEDTISILVLSPTRELALQIAKEANDLLTFQKNKKVVCVVGGTNINTDKKHMSGNVSILVATPGRLLDHLQNTSGMQSKVRGMKMLILDEADQLLEMGFKPDIDRILSFLPSRDRRQTLLFSATVPKAVREIANQTLRSGYEYVDTVGEETEQTHEHVNQELVTVRMDEVIPALIAILVQKMTIPNFKIIVFFTTARVAGFMGDLFSKLNLKVLQIHSRMSQSARTKTSEKFRIERNVVLFSSDVSARGMDYPDVTFVLQVGSTDKAQYIHRLGRTARAGKEGSGMLLLCDFEEASMLKELKDLRLSRTDASSIGMSSYSSHYVQAMALVRHDNELKTSAEQAYQAWLGYYNGRQRVLGWDKETLVQRANDFSATMGLNEPPGLQKKTIGKMGLKGVRGLKIAPFEER